jgi:REP element-mobilizing transposase RayT
LSQSLASILVHIIFSTKTRLPLIRSEIKQELYAYIVSIARSYDSHVHEIGGVNDHVHLLLSLPRTMSLSKLIEEIKKGSSKWIKTKGTFYNDFSWQRGYGAFSIGRSNFDPLSKYIKSQEEHHSKVSFQDEYRILLKKYGVAFDEKYIWD